MDGNSNTQIQNIIFQLKNLVMQLENIMQIQHMGMPNLSNQLQNMGMQMLNIGMQMINMGIIMPNFGIENSDISQQLKYLGSQIQNIGFNIDNNKQMQMNMQMQINQMMINPVMNNVSDSDNFIDKWNLRFENGDTNIIDTILISPKKTVRDAINLYKIKANIDKSKTYKFIFNSRELYPDMEISKSGLSHLSKIIAISTHNTIGG